MVALDSERVHLRSLEHLSGSEGDEESREKLSWSETSARARKSDGALRQSTCHLPKASQNNRIMGLSLGV